MKNADALEYNNGLAEGSVNKLKVIKREFENNYTTKRIVVVQRVQEVKEIIKSLQTIQTPQRNKQQNSNLINREFGKGHTRCIAQCFLYIIKEMEQ